MTSAPAEGFPGAPSPAEPATPGVLVTPLRAGTGDPLFVIPGLEGDPDELAALASAMTQPPPVLALTVLPTGADGRRPGSVGELAATLAGAVRAVSPDGPVRIAGYSFGALLALETARDLTESGGAVDALFLIEPIYDERYWPRRTWLAALARRSLKHLRLLAGLPPSEAAAQARRRGAALARRVARRRPGADGLIPVAEGITEPAARAYAALAAYRPRAYPGPVTLIAGERREHFGCDAARLWRPYLPQADVRRVDADHLTIVRDATPTAAVAAVMDARLAARELGWPGLRPEPGFERVLLVSTMRWFSAARLAHTMVEAGFQVGCCGPARHPVRLVDGLVAVERWRRLAPRRSLTRAVRAVRPDVIVADDERSLAVLRRLQFDAGGADPELAALLTRSIGAAADWPALASRAALAREAARLGVPTPATAVVADAAAVRSWARREGTRFVLKTDGSWGGRGVAVVDDGAAAAAAYRTLARPPGLLRCLKRAVANQDAEALITWARHQRPVVNAQQFCDGRDAIATAVCVDGQVRAVRCLEVAGASEPRGPAAIVRPIDHLGMIAAVERVAARFALTGFLGFDFRLDDDDVAHLLEVNPRATPTCHLLARPPLRDGCLALFPLDARPEDVAAAGAMLDVPAHAPRLVAHGARLERRQHSPVAIAARRAVRRCVGRLTG